MSQKDRSGILHFREDRFGIGGRDVKVLGRQQVRQPASIVGILREDQRSVIFEALPREVASRKFCELLFEFDLHGSDQRRVPGDEDSRTGAVFSLRDQIAGDEIGLCGCIGQHDDFAGAGDAVDVDFAEHELLGQRDEQVAGADDLDSVGGATTAISFTPAT
ncbi:MAG: hypothetical protein FD138_4243 [Planctomycetota bacterium]|nr:MAG: hypothetical protein FD138_4243 [Planctomycetota bacterium]